MSFLNVQRLAMLVFFLQPVAFGSWLPRIPDVQEMLGLGPAGLVWALLGLPCGTLLTLRFAGPIVGKIGPRRTLLIGFVLYTIAVSLPALAMTPVIVFLCLMLAGSAISFIELGLNVQADTVEKATGSLIMSTSHGFWSLGIMTGSLIGSGWRRSIWKRIGPSRWWRSSCCQSRCWRRSNCRMRRPEPHPSETGKRSAWSLPSLAVLGICFFVCGITMTEEADGGAAGLGYSVFAMMVAVWRRSPQGAIRRGAVGARG